MSNIFFRGNHIGQGWYYKYKNEVSGPHDTQKQAENALMVRIIDTKPQRGRSDPLSVKP